ncbi:hypothetical protein H5410_004516 [Solanum commersonii]|uniref:Uncharacterized protein n=1 Tax=Solanum commersonii TaxID=4109 RepID=A0A9J6B8M2_SOLCO|nr:hypothetical protein H5410_004516 [Solanum commersonii]
MNQHANLSMNKAFAAMGNLSEEESEYGELENKSLLAIEQADEYDFLALIAISESEEEEEERSIFQPQETIQALMAGLDSEEDEEEDIHGKSANSKRELIMEDYASLREENENLGKQNHHFLSKITEISNNLDSMTKRNEELNKELHMTTAKAENSMRWTTSSILLDNSRPTSARHGIGFDKKNCRKTTY